MGNILLTKADTLIYLKNAFGQNNITIDNLLIFKVQDWISNPDMILSKVAIFFNDEETLVVRSSALGEDFPYQSKAGFFKTVLNVDIGNKEGIANAINSVIASYSKDNRSVHPSDQIIVQTQLTEALLSGVLFTSDIRLGAPYYVINYDDSTGKTDTVTRGLSSKTRKIAWWIDPNTLYPPWREILLATKEIEKMFPDFQLDIEFGVDQKNVVHLFQSRFLGGDPTSVSHSTILSEMRIRNEVKSLQNQVEKAVKHDDKIPTILTDMSDWNPAEILGGRPNPLDVSIYRYLVTKSAWNSARTSIGYTDVTPSELMITIGSKPYIDTKVSFRSLTPNNLDDDHKERLINYYLNKLRNNPRLQDKIEFEIVFSSYDFNFKNRRQELIYNGFTVNDISKIERELLLFTKNILRKSESIFREDLAKVDKLHVQSPDANTISDFNNSIRTLFSSLLNCREYGTIPFARLARLAFVGISLMMSMVNEKIITQDGVDIFLNGINSITKKFVRDSNLLMQGNMTPTDFFKAYGHLRPGTYNILAPRYYDMQDFILSGRASTPLAKQDFVRANFDEIFDFEKIQRFLSRHDIDIESANIFYFIEKSIEYRELSKFYFTKVLSNSLELLALSGEKLGFSREEVALLTLDDLRSIVESNVRPQNAKSLLMDKISRSKERKESQAEIPMPPVIMKPQDLEVIEYFECSPNFVTQKKVHGDLLLLDGQRSNWNDIENKIVAIESADPGFDWIFVRSPKALITKHGGVASHMAIRCAELGIPAAIGCGDLIFDRIVSSAKITLDCEAESLLPL
ncbi:MAG: PEP-utilizing enzyme [Chloroflexota bacterium]